MSTSIYQTKKAVVYRYINSVSPTLKCYVGFTTDLEQRDKKHQYNAKSGSETAFYRAIRKYGWEHFHREILDESDDVNFALKVLEPRYIKLCNSFKNENGYNMTLGGEGSVGCVCSEENKTKKSKSKTPKDVLNDLYLVKKLSSIKIAKIFEASSGLVLRWLRSYKIPIGKQKPPKDVLFDLYCIDKLSSIEIGKMFEVSNTTVCRWLRYYEILIRQPKQKPTKDVLFDLYYTKKLGSTKIGLLFKVSPHTVLKWLRQYKIPIRKTRISKPKLY